MIVREISPIGDSDSASLLVSDDTHEVVAFHHPSTLTVGATLTDPLDALDAENVVRAASDVVSIRRIGPEGFAHRVVGLVRSVDNGSATVGVGRILIANILLPGDIVVGEFVEFTVDRMDAVA